ncbi:MAG: helix-turn-helix domain-containing protein, partial [Epibacterium sp.]|nr:helix-turn-helix domain-containing protein [Epibacterium sp.]NQX75939.1 helix-turn-helix domain-containing protein [Epibacterium sp.]
KSHNLTQQALGDRAGISAIQIRRYEAGKTAPNMDAIKRLALALNVSADELIFEPNERLPQDDQLRMQFEAIAKLNSEDQHIVTELIDAFIKKHRMKEVMADAS